MHIFKGFDDQSDTYHNTRAHYLMEQDPFLLQDQAKVMDATAADKVEALKKTKDGPSRAMLKSFWLSVLHETCLSVLGDISHPPKPRRNSFYGSPFDPINSLRLGSLWVRM